MLIPWLVLLGAGAGLTGAAPAKPQNYYRPQFYLQGDVNKATPYNVDSLQLSSQGAKLELDYGAITSGFPIFAVESASGDYVEMEIHYSEGYGPLNGNFADGPYPFSSQLANNFRTETVNITDVVKNQGGKWQSYFQQGSQRFQSIRLTRGKSLKLSYIGFVPTSATTSKQDKSGDARTVDTQSTFSCNFDMWNRIWQLGPKATQHACFRKGSQPSTWDIKGDGNGAYIRGQRAARSSTLTGKLPESYTLSFEAKIVRGGFGWVLNAGIGGWGPSFYVTSSLPNATTYSTFNRTLLPPNTITFGDGFGIVNQTTLPAFIYRRAKLPTIKHDRWYKVDAAFTEGSRFTVSIDGKQYASVNQKDYPWLPGPSPFYLGPTTIGFGGWQDQDAYYRNVVMKDATGKVVYSNDLNSQDALGEYGVLPAEYDTCLDGGKRDRLIWLGDFYQTSAVKAVSDNDYATWKGTLQASFDHASKATNAVGISNPIGINTKYAEAWSFTESLILSDYQLDFLNSIYLYYISTGDLSFVKQNWKATQAQIGFSSSFLDQTTQLWAPPSTFKGAPNGTASSSMFVETLNNVAILADAVGDSSSATSYRAQAEKTKTAVNTLLWRPETGSYALSTTNDAFSYIDLAFSSSSGVANATQIASQVARLKELVYTLGYVADTTVAKTSEVDLAPYPLGYLLEGLGKAGYTDEAAFLLKGVWTAMAKPGPNYSGASWEYVNPDGTPGLGPFTSLDHPWGAGATPFLTRYALGLRPTSVAYKTWVFAPLKFKDLSNASGSVKTPRGQLSASWTIQNGKLSMTVQGPPQSTGLVTPFAGKTFTVNGKKGQKAPIKITNSGKTTIVQE
ncbi:hypothetical protein OIO90_001006 [Microbotryomycetes sp. JL221]|nr:hypothetical protein OIO90_001006 [Microbotryomycetes sp. JL221]